MATAAWHAMSARSSGKHFALTQDAGRYPTLAGFIRELISEAAPRHFSLYGKSEDCGAFRAVWLDAETESRLF